MLKLINTDAPISYYNVLFDVHLLNKRVQSLDALVNTDTFLTNETMTITLEVRYNKIFVHTIIIMKLC